MFICCSSKSGDFAQRGGAVCAIQYKGEVFYGRSFKGFNKGEFPDLHPILDKWIKKNG